MKMATMRGTLFLLFFAITNSAIAQGFVLGLSHESRIYNSFRSLNVYLPLEYDFNDPTVRYPVIYFLHGSGTNQDGYTAITVMIDSLRAENKISPMLMVFPDGSAGQFGGSYYSNSALYGSMEDYIAFEVVPFIDSEFHTAAEREQRFIMGHSMGGYGAMRLAVDHPEIFRGSVSHSGIPDLTQFKTWIPTLLSENGSAPPYNFTPSRIFTIDAFAMAGAWSPNLSRPPYFVDFPLDSQGNLIDSVFARWQEHNPAQLISHLSPEDNLALFFDCGLQDRFLIVPWNDAFADSLDRLGLPYEYQTFQGGHGEKLLARLRISIAWVDSVFKAPPPVSAVQGRETRTPTTFALYQNFPNPFNPTTNIRFALPKQSAITLKVYDVAGREVLILAEGKFSAGLHEVPLATGRLASGLYFCRLSVEGFSQTRKLTVMK